MKKSKFKNSIYKILLYFKYFIYSFMKDTGREAETHRQSGKQTPCREPDVGLNLGTRITL